MKRKSRSVRDPSIKEVCDGKSYLTEEDVQRVVREELERAKSHSAEYCQSCTGKALIEIVQQLHSMEERMRSTETQMCSMKNSILELKQAVELAIIGTAPPQQAIRALANAKSMEKKYAKNLRLQFQNQLSLPVYTGMKLEGEKGAPISVALSDADTGDVVTSGPESSIRLDVVVLEGDFDKDDEDNWTHEEFESFVVEGRIGRRQLLIGDHLVPLKGGVGKLGELTFTDNSSWNRSKKFRIGLKVASGYFGNTRIREAKTDAFPVKEHRGQAYKKHYPPVPEDEVWRLEKIAKDGIYHRKLVEVGINTVMDFRHQLYMDPIKLRENLGGMTPKNWDILVDHAKTCRGGLGLYLYYSDGTGKHGAVFDGDCRLIGLVKDRVYSATYQLSAQEKEHGHTIVKKALGNINDVRELSGESFSGFTPEKSSISLISQVLKGQIENLTPVQKRSSPSLSQLLIEQIEKFPPVERKSTSLPLLPSQVLKGQIENLTPVQKRSSSLSSQVLEGQIENLTPVHKRSSSLPSQVLEGQIENLTPVQKSSSPFPSQVAGGQIEILAPVQCSWAPRDCAAPIGRKAPLADAGSSVEGHDGASPLVWPVPSQYINSRNDMEFSVDERVSVSVSPHMSP